MTMFDWMVIVIGIWGCIHLVGNIIIEIAEIKMNANPFNKLFGSNKKDEERKDGRQ